MQTSTAQFLASHEVHAFTGPVVVIDVIRAFTTAAYALAGGARAIYLVAEVREALAFKRANPDALALGEDRGLRPDGFDFSNSPVAISRADVVGRTLVQRTSAGTRGALAAGRSARLWCASLVCASATAQALRASGLGTPAYVITGRFSDAPESGADDLATARFIEAVRLGTRVDAAAVAHEVGHSEEAVKTLRLGEGHVHPDDIALATRVDAFDFAMEAQRDADGRLRLTRS